MPTVITYEHPKIDFLTAGIKFSGRCEEDSTFILKTRILSIDKRADELLIFLTENQIIQLVELKNIRDIYDNIINWLST